MRRGSETQMGGSMSRVVAVQVLIVAAILGGAAAGSWAQTEGAEAPAAESGGVSADSGSEASATEASSTEASALWAEYEEAAQRFSESYSTTDSVDPRATRGNRLYRKAVEDGEALIAVLDRLLAAGAVRSSEERMAVVDALLTTGQIIGSLRVEIRACEAGRDDLQTVLDHPGIETRPILKDSAQKWLERANDCIEEEAVAEARRARERQIAELERQIAAEGDEAQLAELRQQLAALQGVEIEGFASEEPRGPVNVAPIAVLSAGLVTLAAGGIWDLTLGDARSTIEDYPGQQQATIDQYREAADAADRIDKAKVPIAVLYGVGGATTLVGVIWMAVKPRRDVAPESEAPPAESLSLTPAFYRGGGGFQVRATF